MLLDQMVTNASVTVSDIRAIARKLVAFHTGAFIDKAELWGSVRAISQLVASNLAEARELAADSLTRASIAAARSCTLNFVITHRQTLDNRARDGRVREGHGNLRCQSVCFADSRPAILGRVKHRKSLRYVDAALELASLAVDLDLLRRSDLTDELIEAYVAETQDSQTPSYCACTSATVPFCRASSKCSRAITPILTMGQRLSSRGSARRLFALARGYAERREASSMTIS